MVVISEKQIREHEARIVADARVEAIMKYMASAFEWWFHTPLSPALWYDADVDTYNYHCSCRSCGYKLSGCITKLEQISTTSVGIMEIIARSLDNTMQKSVCPCAGVGLDKLTW